MSFANAMASLQLPFLKLQYGRDTRYRTLNAVIDASKRNDLISVKDFGQDGKLRKVTVNYYPIDCDGVGDCSDNICDTGIVQQPKQREFTLDKCVASKVFALNREDVRKVGDSWTFSQHAETQIRSKIDSVRKTLNDQIALFLRTNVGCQPDGTPSKAISLTDPNTGAIRPKGLFDIEKTLQDSGMIDPVIVGGGDVFSWEKGLSIGTANAQGQRIDMLQPGNVYYDSQVDASFGDNTKGHVVAFSAQALKFISWNANVGMFATDMNGINDLDNMYSEGDDYLFGTIVDPLTGIVWDLDVIFDKCTKQWKFQYRLNWGIFLMPEWVCNINCVNGIFHFTTCLPSAVECPQVTPPTVMQSKVFSWTPDAAKFPLHVASLELAGQATSPNMTATNVAELAAILNDSVQGYSFSANGLKIEYTGFKAISGKANKGSVTIAFASA